LGKEGPYKKRSIEKFNFVLGFQEKSTGNYNKGG